MGGKALRRDFADTCPKMLARDPEGFADCIRQPGDLSTGGLRLGDHLLKSAKQLPACIRLHSGAGSNAVKSDGRAAEACLSEPSGERPVPRCRADSL